MLKRLEILLPSLSEQARVVRVLVEGIEGVERARAAAKTRLEAVNALYGAYLREAFGSSESGAWPRIPLGQMLAAPLKTGISRSGGPSASKHCLTLSAVRGGTLDLAACKSADVSDFEAEGNWVLPGAYYVVRGNGNVSLVGRGGHAPRVIERPVLYPDLLIQVLSDSAAIEPDFLRFVMDSAEVRRDIEGRSRTAAGIYKISQGNLAEVRVPLPPLSVQRRVAMQLTEHAAGVTQLRESATEELEMVRSLSAALLRQAFSGNA